MTKEKEIKKADKKTSKVEELNQKLKEEQEKFLRFQAEFANFKKRTEENQSRIYDIAIGELLSKFINVFDDFELALKNCSDIETFKKGIELVYAKAISTSEEFGLEKIKTLNEQFDPHIHEALLAESSEKSEQTIIEELQAGYKLKDKILRTAKVKVAKK